MSGTYVSAELAEKMATRINARANTAEGWSTKDTPDMHGGSARKIARELCAQQKLFPAPMTGGFRYFATPELRDKWVAIRHKAPAGRPAGPNAKFKAAFGPDDKAKNAGEVQIQRIKTPPGRFEVTGPVVGCGFMAHWHELRAA